MDIKLGTTRMVLLMGRYAIKVPLFWKGMVPLLKGWLGNVDERRAWRRSRDERLCPTIFSLFGILNIMHKVESIDGDFDKRWILAYFKDVGTHVDVCSGWKNFGLYKGRLVLSDYAVCRESDDQCPTCDGQCYL